MSESARRTVTLGYLTAVTIPPLGLIVGLAVALRREPTLRRHATLMIAISLIATVVWVAVFLSGAISATDNTIT